MKTKSIKPVRFLLNEQEHLKLFDSWKKSTMRTLSDYIRHVLFGRPIMMNVRNQSMDELMQELVLLKKTMNSTAAEFNRTAHRLLLHPSLQIAAVYFNDLEEQRKEMLRLAAEINSKIAQAGELWLQ